MTTGIPVSFPYIDKLGKHGIVIPFINRSRNLDMYLSDSVTPARSNPPRNNSIETHKTQSAVF